MTRAEALLALIKDQPKLALSLGKTLRAAGFVLVGRDGLVWIHPRDNSMVLIDGTTLVPFHLNDIDHALKREARAATVAWWCKGTGLTLSE